MEAPVGIGQREFFPSKHPFHTDELTAKFAGRAILSLFKDPVEVGDIVESTVVTDLTDALFGFDEPTGRIADASVVDIIDKGLTGSAFDESIEGYRAHIDQF